MAQEQFAVAGGRRAQARRAETRCGRAGRCARRRSTTRPAVNRQHMAADAGDCAHPSPSGKFARWSPISGSRRPRCGSSSGRSPGRRRAAGFSVAPTEGCGSRISAPLRPVRRGRPDVCRRRGAIVAPMGAQARRHGSRCRRRPIASPPGIGRVALAAAAASRAPSKQDRGAHARDEGRGPMPGRPDADRRKS